MDFVIIAQAVIALCSLASVIVSLLNRKKIDRVHLEINSRMDQLLKTEKGLSHAEGFIAGKNGGGSNI